MISRKNTVLHKVLFVCAVVFCAPTHAEQRLDMEGTAIIGNKELPKVLYIVPWKSSEPIALSTPAFASVLDEPFQTVDRSTFKREIEFYNNIYSLPDGRP